MTNPFDSHPDVRFEKKYNNILTLDQIYDTIDKEIEEVFSWSPSVWGFTRDDFIKSLEKLKEELKKKCQN